MTPKRKAKHAGGRPREGRVKLTCYPLPATVSAIKARVGGAANTIGKVLDAAFDK